LKNPIIHIRLLGKKEKKTFFNKYKTATPRHITHCGVYAAFHELKCIGGLVLDKKPLNTGFTAKNVVGISYLYIAPKYRGLGLGETLISKILNKYKNITLTTGLYTYGSIIHIFKKLNFRIFRKIGNINFWIFEKEVSSITEESLDWVCKKYSCKMLKSVCIKRQLLASLPSNFQKRSLYYETCFNCSNAFKEGETER